MDDISLFASSVSLPNGVMVPNRLAKAAMEEGIGWGGGLPDERHRRLYSRWGEGEWGIIITGNVQVDPKHLATPHDRIITPSTSSINAYAALHHAIISASPSPDIARPVCLVQLSHAGLQSSSTICLSRWPWTPAVAPCSSRPDTSSSIWGWIVGHLIWPMKSRTITDVHEWLGIVDKFVQAAKVVELAGWAGVQIHSAHGYLLAEYLSPLTNPSPVPLPGVPELIPPRLHLLYLILQGVHAVTSSTFVKAVKINCSDFVQGGLDEAQAAEVVKTMVSWKLVDILEISGGNYSSPAFADFSSITTSPRQTLFSHFTTSLLPHLPSPPEGPAIMLTGGLHSRPLIASSLRERACDLAGIGRPACVKPTLAKDIVLNGKVDDANTGLGGYAIRGGEFWKWVLGGGGSSSSGKETKGGEPLPATYLETERGIGTQGEAVSSAVPSKAINDRVTEREPLLAPSSASSSKATVSRAADSKKKKKKKKSVPVVGAGISTFWHEWQLSRIGRGVEPDMHMDWGWGGMVVEMIWWGLIWEGLIWGLWQRWKERERREGKVARVVS